MREAFEYETAPSPPVKYLKGKDFKYLCINCRAEVDNIVKRLTYDEPGSLDYIYTSNKRGAMMYCRAKGLLCSDCYILASV